VPGELATIDLPGVEIMSVGGPVHAIGSPPEGDHWTQDHLRQMADAAKELEGELRPPNKIGHSSKQKLLANSGLTDGEMPAAGWLENVRLSEDGNKLLADVKKVPAKLGSLIQAGAWRTRSAELSRVTSQKTGKSYDWVVTGLAWLGGKRPSISTLDDVVRLYESDDDRVVRRCLAQEENEDSYSKEAVDALRENAFDDAAGKIARAADTRAMAEITLTEEKARELATSLGVEGEIDADKLIEGAKARVEDKSLSAEQQAELAKSLGIEGEVTPEKLLEAAKAKPEPKRENSADDDELKRKLEEVEKEAKQATEDLRLERRRNFVEDELIATAKIAPGDRKKWEDRYDKDAELARSFAEDLQPDPVLLRELGSDEEGTESEVEERRKLEEADSSARLGIPKEELI
jgi:hypothetical protein